MKQKNESSEWLSENLYHPELSKRAFTRTLLTRVSQLNRPKHFSNLVYASIKIYFFVMAYVKILSIDNFICFIKSHFSFINLSWLYFFLFVSFFSAIIYIARIKNRWALRQHFRSTQRVICFGCYLLLLLLFPVFQTQKERVLNYNNQENVLAKVFLLFCVSRQPVQKQEKRKEVERFSKTCMFSLCILLNNFVSKRRAKLVGKESGN